MSAFNKLSSQERIELEKCSIQDLRKIGKDLDIFGATTLSKSSLVEKIIEKVLGKKYQAEQEDSGRPNGTYGGYTYAREELATAMCASPDYNEGRGEEIKTGVATIVDGKARVVRYSDEFSMLSANACPPVVGDIELEQGDCVDYLLNKDNEAIVLSVNGMVGNVRPEVCAFSEMGIVYPVEKYRANKSIDLFNPIFCGGRNVFVGENFVPESYSYNAVKNLQGQCNLFVLSVGMSLLDKFSFNEFADDIIELKNTEKFLVMTTRLQLLSENLKRLAEAGQNVVVYIPNYVSVKNFIESNRIDFDLSVLFRLGACYSSGGSITIITCGKVDDTFSWLEQYATNIIYVERTLWGQVLNPEKSQTLFLDKILTKEELEERSKKVGEWKTLEDNEKFVKFEGSE